MPKKKVVLTIDKKLYSNFKKYCKANALKVSQKVELMIEDEIKDFMMEQKKLDPKLVEYFEHLISKKLKAENIKVPKKAKTIVKQTLENHPKNKKKNVPSIDQLRYRKGI